MKPSSEIMSSSCLILLLYSLNSLLSFLSFNSNLIAARVSANGTLISGTGISSVTKLSAGQYRLYFSIPKTNTNYKAVVSINNGGMGECSIYDLQLNSFVVKGVNSTDSDYRDIDFTVMVTE